MPKLKSHRGAAKRFKMTAGGKIRRSKAYKRHILTRKSSKAKRQLRAGGLVSRGDRARVKRLLA